MKAIWKQLCLLALIVSAFPIVNTNAALISANTITNDAKTIGLWFDPPLTLPSATNLANYKVLTKLGTNVITSVSVKSNASLVTLQVTANSGEFFLRANDQPR